MRLLITLDEVKKIVADTLIARGLPIKLSSVAMAEHVEGMYDDQQQVVDGITFELEAKT